MKLIKFCDRSGCVFEGLCLAYSLKCIPLHKTLLGSCNAQAKQFNLGDSKKCNNGLRINTEVITCRWLYFEHIALKMVKSFHDL